METTVEASFVSDIHTKMGVQFFCIVLDVAQRIDDFVLIGFSLLREK